MVQRAARRGRVVLRARLERDVLDIAGVQLGERRGTAREGHPARLVGERQRDLRAGAGERVDGVALQRLQVVEAVEEDGGPTPGGGPGAQRVERRRLVEARVEPAEALQRAAVAGEQATDLVGVAQAAGVARSPGAQRLRQALRRDPQRLELVDEAQQLDDEPARPRRAGEGLERRGLHRARCDALAGKRAERTPAHATAARTLLDQPREAHDVGTEHDARGRELRAVALDILEARHDEDRLGPALQRGAIAVEDDLGLLRVGGTGDELQGHSHIVARRGDGLTWRALRQPAGTSTECDDRDRRRRASHDARIASYGA